jgi:hypothetical protein
VLRGKTGQTAMVDNLAELWAAAEQLGKGPCDPLDDTLLDTLSRGRRP